MTALIKEHRRHLSHCRAWYDRTANYYATPPTSDRGQWHLRPSNRDFSTHQRVRHQNSFARAIGYATILAQAGDIMTEGRLCTLAYRHARLIPSQYQRILFQREREKVARQDHGNQKLKQPE